MPIFSPRLNRSRWDRCTSSGRCSPGSTSGTPDSPGRSSTSSCWTRCTAASNRNRCCCRRRRRVCRPGPPRRCRTGRGSLPACASARRSWTGTDRVCRKRSQSRCRDSILRRRCRRCRRHSRSNSSPCRCCCSSSSWPGRSRSGSWSSSSCYRCLPGSIRSLIKATGNANQTIFCIIFSPPLLSPTPIDGPRPR